MPDEIKKEPKPIRQIIIETDGDAINLVKADVSGRIELIGVLENLIKYLRSQV